MDSSNRDAKATPFITHFGNVRICCFISSCRCDDDMINSKITEIGLLGDQTITNYVSNIHLLHKFLNIFNYAHKQASSKLKLPSNA